MSTLLFDEPPLVVSPTLACAIGLQEAIVLQQMHYWASHSKHVHAGRRWVYNTYEEWAMQFPFWKPESIRKIVANLRAKDLVDVEKLSSDPANRTNYYAINYEVLKALSDKKAVDQPEESTACPSGRIHRGIRKNPPHQPEESTACLYRTETTTETTQENHIAATPNDPDADSVSTVFEHWKRVMQSPRSRLDDKRRRAINAAIKLGYTTRELLKAVDGCSKSPHNMGLNDRQTKFNDIELILRNAANIDRFIGLADNPPASSAPRPAGQPLNKQEALEARNREVAARLTAKFHAQHGGQRA